jgi:hypothetical protein
VLPALARYARAGDRQALLLAAVLMRRRLRAIATHDGYLPCGAEEMQETLTLFFTLLRTAAEADTLTERSMASQTVRRLTRSPSVL